MLVPVMVEQQSALFSTAVALYLGIAQLMPWYACAPSQRVTEHGNEKVYESWNKGWSDRENADSMGY